MYNVWRFRAVAFIFAAAMLLAHGQDVLEAIISTPNSPQDWRLSIGWSSYNFSYQLPFNPNGGTAWGDVYTSSGRRTVQAANTNVWWDETRKQELGRNVTNPHPAIVFHLFSAQTGNCAPRDTYGLSWYYYGADSQAQVAPKFKNATCPVRADGVQYPNTDSINEVRVIFKSDTMYAYRNYEAGTWFSLPLLNYYNHVAYDMYYLATFNPDESNAYKSNIQNASWCMDKPLHSDDIGGNVCYYQ